MAVRLVRQMQTEWAQQVPPERPAPLIRSLGILAPLPGVRARGASRMQGLDVARHVGLMQLVTELYNG